MNKWLYMLLCIILGALSYGFLHSFYHIDWINFFAGYCLGCLMGNIDIEW